MVAGRPRGRSTIAFGDIGLNTVQHGQLSSQQIEAARIAMMRHIKRGGKVWIRVFPTAFTAKPLETLRVSRKGARWVGALALNTPVAVLYEIKGVSLELAR